MEARAGWAAGCDRGSQTTIPYRYKVQNDRPGHDVYLTEPRRLVPRYASQSVLYEASARPGSWLGLPGLSTPGGRYFDPGSAWNPRPISRAGSRIVTGLFRVTSVVNTPFVHVRR